MSRHGTGACFSILLLGSATASSPPPPGNATEMLARADAAQGEFSEGVIRLRVVTNRRGKQPLEDRMDIFLKGRDRSLVVFRDGKQKGRKILTQGDRVVLIVPGASRPIPVSKTQRLTGAASFGDVARVRLADDYDATLRPEARHVEGDDGESPCWVFDLAAKNKGAAYPAAVLWVRQADGLKRRLRLALASGKEAKDIAFTSYDDRHRIATMEIRDLLLEGQANVTNVFFESYEKRTLDPAIFDPEGARAVP